MIRCIYIPFIAPLTIYLGRSFPSHVRCLNSTCSFFFVFFFAVFAELFLASHFCRVIFSWPLQKDKFVLYFFFALQCFEHARSVWDC